MDGRFDELMDGLMDGKEITMCDRELLVDYLYGELAASEREAFDRHLASCAECRDEIAGLNGTRAHLTSWVPPEPELGVQIVRGLSRPVSVSRRWWGLSPAWGLAAAAMFVGAVSAAIAHVEITAGTGGITVRTGWNRTVETTAAPAGAIVSAADMQRIEARMRDLEAKVVAQPAPVAASLTPTVAVNSRMSDAELLRVVRRLIDDSEARQEGELARRILQVNRVFEVARRTDLDRVGRGMEQIQRTSSDAYQATRRLEDLYVRVGVQR